MQIDERNKYISLFDIYGKMLSRKQFEVMDKFLNLDILETEIAELQGESRQSVHDAIIKAKKQLDEFEDNLKILSLHQEVKSCLKKAKDDIIKNKTKSAVELIEKSITEL